MKVNIRQLNGTEAAKMCNALSQFSCEAILTSEKNNFRVDAKSLLGAVAAAYGNDAVLEINELDPHEYAKLNSLLKEFYQN